MTKDWKSTVCISYVVRWRPYKIIDSSSTIWKSPMRPRQKQAHGGKPSAMRWVSGKQVQLRFLKAIFLIAQSSRIVDKHVKMYFLLFLACSFFFFFNFWLLWFRTRRENVKKRVGGRNFKSSKNNKHKVKNSYLWQQRGRQDPDWRRKVNLKGR